MAFIQKLINNLASILYIQNIQDRMQLITDFQQKIWEHESETTLEAIWEILENLAYDLDFYEPDPNIRREDPSYYGDEQLQEEIQGALARLNELGIQPNEIFPRED